MTEVQQFWRWCCYLVAIVFIVIVTVRLVKRLKETETQMAPKKDPVSRIADAAEEFVRLYKEGGAASAVGQKLDLIITMLTESKVRENKMATDLSALQAEVERNGQVDQSAIVLLNGLAAKIEELKTDPAALQAFADSLKGSSDALAAAVVANTPAA